MDWNKYFTMMSDWKKLPAYKAEPRIDSLIGYYLQDFMADYLKTNIIGIIPELPIRLATVKPLYEGTNYADRSYKVDFYLTAGNGINYFIEFKTDSCSRREKQDIYLSEAKKVGMSALIEGIYQITKVSSYKNKYNHLLNKLADFKLIDNNKNYTGKSNDIDVIYIQPHVNDDNNCIDFKRFSNWLRNNFGDNKFELEFADTLEKWSEH